MPEYVYEETTGERFLLNPDGSTTPAPELGALDTVMVSSGKRLSDLGRGFRSMLGEDVTQEAAEAERYFAPVEAESPYLAMVGEALPSLVTAPLSAGGVLAGSALQAGLGAAEGYLDYDPRATGGQRALAGALGGVIGEGGGRVAGRILNMARGLVSDLGGRVGPIRAPADNPAADAYERLGGQTLAYQRLEPDTKAARLAERAARGAEASINPPTVIRQTLAQNDKLHRDVAAKAVGLDPRQFNNLGPDFIDAAETRFNEAFTAVEQNARAAGDITVSETLASKLGRLRAIKDAKQDFGLFESLDRGVLGPGEYVEARNTLADAIQSAYANTPKAAKRLELLLEELDGEMEQKLGKQFGEDFARLREQYRVFSILEAPNVIDAQGNINVRTLNNRLKSKTSGFGRTATAAKSTTNSETGDLITLMRAADNPEFKAFSTSRTAENLQLGQTVDAAAEAAAGLLSGDVRPGLGLLGRTTAPGIVGLSQMGGGGLYKGAYTPAPESVRRAGGVIGRSLLDEALYPFVGAEDERVQ